MEFRNLKYACNLITDTFHEFHSIILDLRRVKKEILLLLIINDSGLEGTSMLPLLFIHSISIKFYG